jgi:hypothetical protein
MSLVDKKIIDQIAVVLDGTVQIREATIIEKDNNLIARTYHRWCIAPGEDYSTQEQQVQDICKVAHTPEVIAAYQAQLEANRLGTV